MVGSSSLNRKEKKISISVGFYLFLDRAMFKFLLNHAFVVVIVMIVHLLTICSFRLPHILVL